MKITSLVICLLVSLGHVLIWGQCNGSNTFLGTASTNWHTASNWSANCVPTPPINGIITIAANCTLMDTMVYSLNSTGNLIINEGKSLSILYGIPNAWMCGDALDYDGQSYATVQIGEQCWMAENLNVGSMILTGSNASNNNVIEKYCYDDSPLECATYGGLYQWNEAMLYATAEGSQGICPTGWHLPSESEWYVFETSLPSPELGSRLAGNAGLWEDGGLKQSSVFGTSGFNALPGGLYEDGSTYSQNFNAFFWTSTSYSVNAGAIQLYFDVSDMLPATSIKTNGYSIRCVKD